MKMSKQISLIITNGNFFPVTILLTVLRHITVTVITSANSWFPLTWVCSDALYDRSAIQTVRVLVTDSIVGTHSNTVLSGWPQISESTAGGRRPFARHISKHSQPIYCNIAAFHSIVQVRSAAILIWPRPADCDASC